MKRNDTQLDAVSEFEAELFCKEERMSRPEYNITASLLNTDHRQANTDYGARPMISAAFRNSRRFLFQLKCQPK